MAKPALLVIDMQNDFCMSGAPFEVRGALSIVPRILELIDAFRGHSLPVIYVIREHAADGSDVEITRRERFLKAGGAFLPGTRGHALVDGLSPRAGEPVVRKRRWSAFHKTELEALLRAQAIDVVVLTGVQTPNCIRATAFSANSLDFEVIVASDACAASDPAVHEANLEDMARIGIQIMGAKDIIATLPSGLGLGLAAPQPVGVDTPRGRRVSTTGA
jgi:nicotinamidase-related amidase